MSMTIIQTKEDIKRLQDERRSLIEARLVHDLEDARIQFQKLAELSGKRSYHDFCWDAIETWLEDIKSR